MEADPNVLAQPSFGDQPGREVEQIVSGYLAVRNDAELIGSIAQHRVEDLARNRDQIGMSHPGSIATLPCFTVLVLAHLGQSPLGDLGVAPVGNERGHAADGMGATAMAGLHLKLRVRLHERHRHRHRRAIGQARSRRRVRSFLMIEKM